jgi:dihydrofolate reductase
VDWLFTDQDYGMAEFFSTVDVAVMGRKTYEKMLELSPEKPFFPRMKHYVFSHTMHYSPHQQVEFVSGDVASWAARVRSQPGKGIWLVGGGDFVRSFLQNKLVNELGLAIRALVLKTLSRGRTGAASFQALSQWAPSGLLSRQVA